MVSSSLSLLSLEQIQCFSNSSQQAPIFYLFISIILSRPSKQLSSSSLLKCCFKYAVQGYIWTREQILPDFIQIIMAEEVDSLHNSKIKNFEQKIINQSLLDIMFYDKLADYLLECCHAEAKPNTLSLFSFLPLFLLTFAIQEPSRIGFLLTIIGLLVHMLLDIANKKQAFRLSKFSLATYYIDHIFDALSCTCIVLIFSRLLDLSAGSTLTAIFFFGMLPFYTHHLTMYNNQYMHFHKISPTTEGLVFTKLMFLIAVFYPQFFQTEVEGGYCIYHVYIGLAALWTLGFVAHDLYQINGGKRVTDAKSGTEEHLPLKNIFVIFIIGYIVLEMTSIESEILHNGSLFYFAFALLTLFFVHIIGNLILAYAYHQSYKQITLPLLIGTGVIVCYYAILVFSLRDSKTQALISKIVFVTVLVLFTVWFLRDSMKNLRYINQVLAE